MRKILIASLVGLLFLAACGEGSIVTPGDTEDPPEESDEGGLVATSIAIMGTGLVSDRSI
jgi:hypothetical protein